MGNLCQRQSDLKVPVQMDIDLEQSSMSFSELIMHNSQLYPYSDLGRPLPLSPKQQHVIVYLDPKILDDEECGEKIVQQRKGILGNKHANLLKVVRFQD